MDGLHSAERDADRSSDHREVELLANFSNEGCELCRAERSDPRAAVSGP